MCGGVRLVVVLPACPDHLSTEVEVANGGPCVQEISGDRNTGVKISGYVLQNIVPWMLLTGLENSAVVGKLLHCNCLLIGCHA